MRQAVNATCSEKSTLPFSQDIMLSFKQATELLNNLEDSYVRTNIEIESFFKSQINISDDFDHFAEFNNLDNLGDFDDIQNLVPRTVL